MSHFRISPQAQTDLDDLWFYVAQDNVDAADRLLDEVHAAFLKISEMPGMGHRRDDLVNEPLRFWKVHSYLIIYRPETSPLEIVRVISGYRDIAAFFQN